MCYSQWYEGTFCTTNFSYVWKKPSGSPEFFKKYSLPICTMVHIAPCWCTSTPYTIVVVHNVAWVNTDKRADRQRTDGCYQVHYYISLASRCIIIEESLKFFSPTSCLSAYVCWCVCLSAFSRLMYGHKMVWKSMISRVILTVEVIIQKVKDAGYKIWRPGVSCVDDVTWARTILFKGAIIFYREGGPSVRDRWSSIFSGSPFSHDKKILAPPVDLCKKFCPPFGSWKKFCPPPRTKNPLP